MLGNQLWQNGLEDDNETGSQLRREVGARIQSTKIREFATLGVVLGYRYDDSPVIISDGSAAPGYDFINYVPTSRPGAIAPHAWLHDGSSLYDHFGKGFTLLANKDASQSLIEEAQVQARAAGVPLKVIQPREAGLQSLYPTRLTLIRPDQHVAWRGNVLPEQSRGLFERVTGRAQVAAPAEVTA